jgi:hypothetical protein
MIRRTKWLIGLSLIAVCALLHQWALPWTRRFFGVDPRLKANWVPLDVDSNASLERYPSGLVKSIQAEKRWSPECLDRWIASRRLCETVDLANERLDVVYTYQDGDDRLQFQARSKAMRKKSYSRSGFIARHFRLVTVFRACCSHKRRPGLIMNFHTRSDRFWLLSKITYLHLDALYSLPSTCQILKMLPVDSNTFLCS